MSDERKDRISTEDDSKSTNGISIAPSEDGLSYYSGPDIWTVVAFAIVLLILIIIPVALSFYANINELIELFFVSIIIGFIGVFSFYFILREASTPSPWPSGFDTRNVTIPGYGVQETILCAEKARAGSSYNQYQLRMRLKIILIEKVQKKFGLSYDGLIKIRKDNLIKMMNDRELAEFLLKKDDLPEKGRWRSKKDDSGWNRLVYLLEKVKAYE